MIDDARIRLQILKNIPALEPWRVEMEEIEFGDIIGCFVRGMPGKKFATRAKLKDNSAFKTEGKIAFELSQQIRAAMASTPDAPLTTDKFTNKIVPDNGRRNTPGA